MIRPGWIALLAGAGISVWLTARNARRRHEEAIARLALGFRETSADFARTHFAARTEIAERVHRVFLATAPLSAAEAQRVQPDDRLVDDLRFDDLDSMATVEFVLALEQEFKTKLPEAEMARVRTLRDIIDYLAANPGP